MSGHEREVILRLKLRLEFGNPLTIKDRRDAAEALRKLLSEDKNDPGKPSVDASVGAAC
jgi:hypothetical protein